MALRLAGCSNKLIGVSGCGTKQKSGTSAGYVRQTAEADRSGIHRQEHHVSLIRMRPRSRMRLSIAATKAVDLVGQI